MAVRMSNSKTTYRIALAGNPNCGKTTLFNALTGTRQHVGNYAGVTVERKTGTFRAGGLEVTAVDLPGVYSLSSSSPEEKVAFQELMDSPVDLIVNVCDAANLQRNLYLTTQLAELGIPYILVLNMFDDAERNGFAFDIPKLESFFGTVVVRTVGTTERGVAELTETIGKVLDGRLRLRPPCFRYNPLVDEAIGAVAEQVASAPGASELGFPARYFAIKLIEGDQATCALPALRSVAAGLGPLRDRLAARTGMSADTLMADTRYGMIAGACREVISISASSRRQLSDRLDKVMTSPVFGLPIFLGIMFAVFAFTFVCGEPLCQLVEMVFGGLGLVVSRVWPETCLPWLRELVIGGVIPGVGGVLTFLPNILLLFLAIAFLEGTGYMNRAAFVMDGFMHRFGLHGKSFIPMLLGFGCTVPAIMATRTIESRRDRLTTILILPLVSCGARFPIYALFIPAFFAARYRALVLWVIYVIGLAFALLFARLLKSTLFRGEEEVFVMELPPYRMPTAKGIAIDLGERAVMYLHKAGTVILAASVILFLVNSYPKTAGLPEEGLARLRELERTVASRPDDQEARRRLEELRAAQAVAQSRATLGGRIGGALSRALVFAGFENRRGEPDWKASSAIVGAFAAKELFVSQLTILYAQDRPRYVVAMRHVEGEDDDGWMRAALADNYTPLSGFCMMLFCLIAMPCIGTVVVVWRETGSLRLTVAQVAGLTLTAYVTATVVYQLGKLLSLGTA